MAQTAANRRRPYGPVEELGKEYADYVVRDPKGRKIGCVKEFFTNARGEPEYIMVRMDLFGMRSVLIPVGFVSIDEEQRTLTLYRVDGSPVSVRSTSTKMQMPICLFERTS